MNKNRRFRDQIYQQFSRIGKALSSPRRIEILDLLSQAEQSVETIANKSGMSIANTSRHLQVLYQAKLVESQKEGVQVYYRLASSEVAEFFQSMQLLGKNRFAEIEQIVKDYLQDRKGMESVDQEALLERIRSGDTIVLDVRPPDEYQAGHLPKAVSVPLKELELKLKDLPKNKQIAAYCRGRYCVLAVEAVDLLRSRGFDAVRMEMGVQDWQARGYEIDQ